MSSNPESMCQPASHESLQRAKREREGQRDGETEREGERERRSMLLYLSARETIITSSAAWLLFWQSSLLRFLTPPLLTLLPHVNTHVTRRATYCVLHTFVRLFGHAHFGHSTPLALSLQCCEKFIESCEQTQQSIAQAAIGLRKGTRHTFWLTGPPLPPSPLCQAPPSPCSASC